MANKILFIRHGESEGNEKMIIQGKLDIYGLTLEGKEQIRTASLTVSKYAPSLIISSPLIRAYQTAEIIKSECGIIEPIVLDSSLEELHLGKLEGITRHQRDVLYQDKYENLKTNNYDYSIFQGEPIGDVKKRVIQAIKNLSKTQNDCIAVVTHGGFMRELCKYIDNNSTKQINFKNGCVLFTEKVDGIFNRVVQLH